MVQTTYQPNMVDIVFPIEDRLSSVASLHTKQTFWGFDSLRSQDLAFSRSPGGIPRVDERK